MREMVRGVVGYFFYMDRLESNLQFGVVTALRRSVRYHAIGSSILYPVLSRIEDLVWGIYYRLHPVPVSTFERKVRVRRKVR